MAKEPQGKWCDKKRHYIAPLAFDCTSCHLEYQLKTARQFTELAIKMLTDGSPQSTVLDTLRGVVRGCEVD